MSARVGLLGCGRWGRHILRDLLSLGCEVTVYGRSERTLRTAREVSPDVEVVHELGEWAAQMDGFVVATPTVDHLAMVDAVLAYGRPIYVEKPLSNDVDAACALHASAEDLVFVMHKWRYHPAIEAMRQIARSGELGAVRGLRTRRLQAFNPHDDVDAIWTLAPHDLSIAAHVLDGPPVARAAFADPLGESGAGLIGHLRVGSTPVTIEVSAATPVGRREFLLSFDEGILRLTDEDYAALFVHRSPRAEPERRDVGDRLPLLAQVEAFVGHLNSGPPPLSDLRTERALLTALGDLRRMAGL